MILEEDTGQALARHALSMVMPDHPAPDAPLQRLAESTPSSLSLPGAALSFVALDHPAESGLSAPVSRQIWKFNE